MSFESQPEVLGLFQLPLEGFTDARNQLAARLRAAGQRDVAATVKALPKPPAAAWAVNQVYWTARPLFDALIRAGGTLRDAQGRGAGPEELREAIRQRRETLQAALRKAEAALAAAGHGAGPQVLRRVSATLEALASGANEGRAGALTEDLEPPGFEALLGLAPADLPAAPPAPSAAPEDGREEAQALASVEAGRAEVEATRLRRRAEEADSALGEARQRLEGARSEMQEAERRLERARERLEQSARGAQDAEARSNEAASSAAEAERAVAAARAALDRVTRSR